MDAVKVLKLKRAVVKATLCALCPLLRRPNPEVEMEGDVASSLCSFGSRDMLRYWIPQPQVQKTG
jgi:hypothetical protein